MGLAGQPCLLSQLIAAFHQALPPCVSKAAVALSSRSPRTNAAHAGAAIVAYLLLTISGDPNPTYCQHAQERMAGD